MIDEDAVERKDVDTEKKLIVDEEKESVSIGFSVFFRYYREFNGSYFFFFIISSQSLSFNGKFLYDYGIFN